MNSIGPSADPDIMLSLAIIEQAKRDVLSESANPHFRASAARFFLSDWYQDLLAFALSGVGIALAGNGLPDILDQEFLTGLLSEAD